MSEQNANPVELFGMRVAHVGINATDPADALEIGGAVLDDDGSARYRDPGFVL